MRFALRAAAMASALAMACAAHAQIKVGIDLSTTGPVSYTHLTLPTKA